MRDAALLEYVTQSPIDELPSGVPACPICDGKIAHVYGRSTTLIGGGDGTVDGDPNHTWEEMECVERHRFSRQTKSGTVWYQDVRTDKVLRGWFGCFERCTYTCRTCGGDVKRSYTKLDGETPHTTSSLSFGPDGPGQRAWWKCEPCGWRVEVPS